MHHAHDLPSRSVIVFSEAVAAARAAGQPIVALESTLITHGMAYPHNLNVARRSDQAIREQGAVPATIAIRQGQMKVGLEQAELEDLARAKNALKASRHNLAAALLHDSWSATTVSATMIVAGLAGIQVFATGGIGGVHRGAEKSFDISADLEELAKTPVVVVCAGPKSILDLPLTLEYLETRGVPVIGLGTDLLPGFYTRDTGLPVPITAPDVGAVTDLVLAHRRLPKAGGMVVAVPVPEADALPRAEAEEAIDQAVAEAEAAGVEGAATTPWLLARVAEITGGRSVKANIALIENNSRVAAQIAAELAVREAETYS
jgi:pseudouridine-5'-phosphate glycosidase